MDRADEPVIAGCVAFVDIRLIVVVGFESRFVLLFVMFRVVVEIDPLIGLVSVLVFASLLGLYCLCFVGHPQCVVGCLGFLVFVVVRLVEWSPVVLVVDFLIGLLLVGMLMLVFVLLALLLVGGHAP